MSCILLLLGALAFFNVAHEGQPAPSFLDLVTAWKPHEQEARSLSAAKLREEHPAKVAEALAALRAKRKKFSSRLDRLARAAGGVGRAKSVALEKIRKKALALIFDEIFYPYPCNFDEFAAIQKEVEGKVQAVRKTWMDLGKRLPRAQGESAASSILEIDTLCSIISPALFTVPQVTAQDLIAEAAQRILWSSADHKIRSYNESIRDILSPEEYENLKAVNDYRIMLGRRAMTLDPRLVLAARKHSRDMCVHNFFSHDSPLPGKETVSERLYNEGYGAPGGENIHQGIAGGKEVFYGWTRSSGHHRNMLKNYTTFGVGGWKKYWTQNFGKAGALGSRKSWPKKIAVRLRTFQVKDDDLDGLWALAKSASQAKLWEELIETAERICKLRPGDKRARQLAGYRMNKKTGTWEK